MSCAPSDRLLQTLKVHVPGVTDDMLSLELFNVMDEFFRRTSAWRMVNEITLEEDTFEYDMNVPADAVLVRVMSMSHNTMPVPAVTGGSTPVNFELAVGALTPDTYYPDGDSQYNWDQSDINAATHVFSYAIYRPDTITITQPPDEEKRKFPLIAVLALSVGHRCLATDCDSWAVEDWMWDMFFQDWLDGVLGRMYGMPAKPWANPTTAVYHARRFRNAMAYRKQEANRGFVYGQPASWRFPRVGM